MPSRQGSRFASSLRVMIANDKEGALTRRPHPEAAAACMSICKSKTNRKSSARLERAADNTTIRFLANVWSPTNTFPEHLFPF